jgi:two-component system OmpR family response regulator
MKILCIDDNFDINMLFETVFSASGHEFSYVTDGRDGIKLLKKNQYDVVLLDLAIPEFSGFDVIESLKKDRLLEKQNIILLTASSISDEEIAQFLQKGVHSYIRKPLDVTTLVERIEQAALPALS